MSDENKMCQEDVRTKEGGGMKTRGNEQFSQFRFRKSSQNDGKMHFST